MTFTNRKAVTGLVLITLAILLCILAYFVYPKNPPQNTPKPTPAEESKNATYFIDGKSYTFLNGRYEEKIENSNSKITIQYFGNAAKADLNSDGRVDEAFLFTKNDGGSGTFFYVAAALAGTDGFTGTNAILLGDRIAPQSTEMRDGFLIVNFAERKAGEPMTTAPSEGVSKYFKVINNVLTEVKK